MAMLPGFNPRPEYLIYDKKNTTENVNSSSKALFVHAKNSESTEINIVGKIGKLTLEKCNSICVVVSETIVGGTLEVIKCTDVKIYCKDAAVVS